MSWPLQPGVGLLRCLRPPSRTRAFLRPLTWGTRCWSAPVPSEETFERPVAACSTPSGSGTAQAGGEIPPGPRFPILGQVCQPLAPVVCDDASAGSLTSASIAGVARSSAVWLAEVGPLSTGFTPQGVPRLDACCVPLTPLSTRSSLRERSLMPLKGAPPPQTRTCAINAYGSS